MNETFADLPHGLRPDIASPEWLNKGDNAWELIAAAMVGLQSVPGLVILYGSMVKKKWAVNSSFMALYAFAAVLICWVLWGHQLSFGHHMTPILGRPGVAMDQKYLLHREKHCFVPQADYVFYQFAFAAITVILLAGSLLGRMNFYAWMGFVPLWLTFSYTIGAFTIWGSGFLDDMGIIDFSGGYVIHLSSGVAGFTAAYWVGPRHSHDRQHFPPNNIIHMLGGAGFLWLGWTGFNGGSPMSAGPIAALAILNTHICTATSLLVWLSLDMALYKKSSVIGAVQGMITGLVCITPGAGVVEPWAAIIMGIMSGSIPWYTMMVLHRRSAFFQSVDDTLGVFHTHAVAGLLGGLLSGILAKPRLLRMFYGETKKHGPGLLYAIIEGPLFRGVRQMLLQLLGAVFITVWNVAMTSLICIFISRFVNLRMDEEDLEIGDDAVHGEEAYALWGDGERHPFQFRINPPRFRSFCKHH
ncbi:Ammonium transporter 3 member like [Actinidia chinensis var. chinensis]|uniref:Ammonium transporter n=1 Tax=Actinidia chinensis var. chinensis TaxID=1590841 RepID=A0A2R6RJ01_ACTCC|nr:Ammonium transporter 3 member like [Actinidia chinensis var. chinensis]